MFKIKITGNEKNKDNGFYSLLKQDTSFHCLADEIYIISEIALKKLKKDKIKFEVIK